MGVIQAIHKVYKVQGVLQVSDLDDNRPFPVQREGRGKEACTIPWWLAEVVYAGYSAQSPQSAKLQSLERMAERGGFGREEVLVYLSGGKI